MLVGCGQIPEDSRFLPARNNLFLPLGRRQKTLDRHAQTFLEICERDISHGFLFVLIGYLTFL